jgi:hypothetical protein
MTVLFAELCSWVDVENVCPSMCLIGGFDVREYWELIADMKEIQEVITVY